MPTMWVRPRQGPKLADLVAEPDTTRAHGDSDSVDVLGSAYAATDGDPATAWTAPQRVVQHKTPPTLTLTLPRPTEVTGAATCAQPVVVARAPDDGGRRPRRRPAGPRPAKPTGPQTVPLKPRVTDTVTVSLLDWEDVIDRNALGFDQLKPPGLAEVAALGADGSPIAPADAARNRAREITVDCDHGPVIAVAGRFVHTAIRTTVGALLDGAPVAAVPCDRDPIALPAGQQELLISPGPQFVVDGGRAARRWRRRIAQCPVTSATSPGVGSGSPRGAGTRLEPRRGCWSCRKASTPAGWRAPAPGSG